MWERSRDFLRALLTLPQAPEHQELLSVALGNDNVVLLDQWNTTPRSCATAGRRHNWREHFEHSVPEHSVPVRPLESAIIKHKAQEYQLDKQDITFLHTARALFTMGHVCICFLPTQPRSPITVSSLPFQPHCRPKIPLKISRSIFCTTSTWLSTLTSKLTVAQNEIDTVKKLAFRAFNHKTWYFLLDVIMASLVCCASHSLLGHVRWATVASRALELELHP